MATKHETTPEAKILALQIAAEYPNQQEYLRSQATILLACGNLKLVEIGKEHINVLFNFFKGKKVKQGIMENGTHPIVVYKNNTIKNKLVESLCAMGIDVDNIQLIQKKSHFRYAALTNF